MNFTCNDVLLIHNNDVLSYAVDSIGNRKYQLYLDMHGPSFLHAEERKDAITCNEIVNDIVNAITNTSVPKGRFLEFDDKNNVWYNVGTGAIPCQRTRLGLLGLLAKSSRKEYNSDKPIVEMSKTKRARTMKALHSNEKMLRAVVNLSDERFKVKDPALINDKSYVPILEKKISPKRSNQENVILSDPEKNSKKRKIATDESVHANAICNDIAEVISNINTHENRLFPSSFNQMQQKYASSGDKQKFNEDYKVIKHKQKKDPNQHTTLSGQDIAEKSSQVFCNPCTPPDVDIEIFIDCFEETDISYMLDILDDTPDNVTQKKNELLNSKYENCNDTFSAIDIKGRKVQRNKPTKVNDYLASQNTYISHNCVQDEYLDVYPRSINENSNESIIPEEFLELLLQ